jgi:hypothetical protein
MLLGNHPPHEGTMALQPAATAQAPAKATTAPVAPQEPAIPVVPAQPGAATGGVTVAGGGQQGTPIILQPPPYRDNDEIPDEVIPLVGMVLGILMTVIIFFPIARAIGRAIDRRTDRSLVKVADVAPQLRNLQESVDAMAIELERISEAQRFTAKLMANKPQELGAGERGRT